MIRNYIFEKIKKNFLNRISKKELYGKYIIKIQLQK